MNWGDYTYHAETILYASLFFLLFLTLLLPTGSIFFRVFGVKGEGVSSSLSIAGAVLLYSYLLALMLALGLSSTAIAAIIASIAILCLSLWLHTGLYRHATSSRGLLVQLSFYCLCLSFCSFPDGKIQNFSPATTSNIFELPVDNLISYNTSRFLSSKINMNRLEVVPLWKATDRGPLSALMNSAIFKLLGLEERDHWLFTTPELFFIYKCLMTFLNTLSLLLIWELCAHYCGPIAACTASLIASSSYFFSVNCLYAWPKLFCATYVILSLTLLQNLPSRSPYRQLATSGLLFAGALLSHNSAIFCLCALAIHSLYRALRRGFFVKRTITFSAALLGGIAPWELYKFLYAKSSSRLIYLHLFCNRDESIARLSLLEAAKKYLENNEIISILGVRLDNLLYPFNFLSIDDLGLLWRAPHQFIEESSHLSFYQLSFALGILFFPMFLYSLFSASREKSAKPFLRNSLISHLALVPALAVFGCAEATSNHHWAYAAYLCGVMQLGYFVDSSGPLMAKIANLAFALNFVALIHRCYFAEASLLFLHTPSSFVYVQVGLFALFLLFCNPSTRSHGGG